MIYTAIEKRSIKLLSLSKTILGQYHTSSFFKSHSVDIISDGKVENIDLLASAIKEALTQAKPTPIIDKDIFLILPQEMFVFARYSIPGDISDAAIITFVKDKLRADLKIDVEELLHDFIVSKTEMGCEVMFYGLSKESYSQIESAFTLLGLNIKNIVPETISYFKLFNKTLQPQKQEKVAYISYQENDSYGFLYDALGLINDKRVNLEDDVVESLKKEIAKLGEEQKITLNRIILSGEKSKDIRQDYFTKDVGVWTNPIDKIVQNFYSDYVKLILSSQSEQFSPLLFSSCLGGYIFECEKDRFKPSSQNQNITISSPNNNSSKLALPAISFVSRRDVVIFLVSFALSFGIIFGASRIKNIANLPSLPTPTKVSTPTAVPAPTNKPTPSISREDIKVKILNGTGIKGKAGEYSTVLKEKNYSEVLSGNADSFDIETTEIQVKKTKKDAVELIKKDLSGLLKFSKVSDLDEEEPADVVIIIGLDSVTPTPTDSSNE